MLRALGWPGDRPSSSEEHQAIEAWNEALSTFATLDTVLPELDYERALRELRRLAEGTTFQPEDEGAPVQIMGEGLKRPPAEAPRRRRRPAARRDDPGSQPTSAR